MILLCGRVTMLALTVCLILVAAVPTLGWEAALNPELTTFSTQCTYPTPCWYGLVPGETRLDTARQRLLDAGYSADSANERFAHFYTQVLPPRCVKLGIGEDQITLASVQLYCFETIVIRDMV
jgi:hypothetical protein